jgi:predicted DNA-binding ArsR family transcriptional regulator
MALKLTPKEKAEELYNTYIDYTQGDYNCKQCALIAVDELIQLAAHTDKEIFDYLEDVKQEIEKL